MPLLSGKRILVVEDEYFLADELVVALEGAGADVVGPYAEAEEAAQAIGLDAAVLNVKVRDGLTYPLAALLRERYIPFLFATGQQMSGEPQEWHTVPWLTKPYDLDALVRLLADLISANQANPEQQQGISPRRSPGRRGRSWPPAPGR